ncbi:hypothetical protein PC129_g18996 [Phytophthora cactorum]|uniref:Uncharacterized protein n=1 Tax=Phytophthora cactorum TaxID=29920 RepID=A0A329RV47_9STRA|nr:hypothetical protein PC111_g18944 [Phytophthora cactorum]KAG2822187.1 hypothetical protein PC112_g11055 [Phytophthora cactorum]KAG2879859.1 hypothetical protein PC114_g22356 [Phytophthora cactorum]KAG2947906.1 hypothetical protein PC117_g6451 [Phytophthora cactorum]KAG2966339.1 hypothetical protein PC118_g19245 [Phytophthora cactorum]
MYALISQQQQQNDGGGDKTTESLYTYYCKYCCGELGKSADAVQVGRITWASGTARELNSNERMLFTFVSSNVRAYARPTTIPMSLRSVTALLFDAAKLALSKLLRREKNVKSPQMRYFCAIYTLAGLIALNVSKIKSSKSVLNTTGESASSQLKREFVAAMKIVRANRAYKRLRVNLKKITAALVVCRKTHSESMLPVWLPPTTTCAVRASRQIRYRRARRSFATIRCPESRFRWG